MEKESKNFRTLDMYVRLCEGKVVNKAEESHRFSVDERSIQRESSFHMGDLNSYVAESISQI